MTDASRAQDQGRAHRRRGRPSAETASLLAAYQDAMRTELRACLGELAGAPAPPGLLPEDGPPVINRPSLKDRTALWDLAIKIGRELGTAVDVAPATTDAEPTARRPRSRKRIDYG